MPRAGALISANRAERVLTMSPTRTVFHTRTPDFHRAQKLIDPQVIHPNLLQLGAVEYPRTQFLRTIAELTHLPGQPGSWARYTHLAQLERLGGD